MILADVNVALWLAIRHRYMIFLVWSCVAMVVVVFLGAGFSARQPITVALDLGISVIRLLLPLFSVVLIQDLIGREFDRKYCLLSMTYPRARSAWLMGRFFGVLTVAATLLVLLVVVLTVCVTLIGQWYSDAASTVSLGKPLAVTVGFLAIDALVISSVAALIAVAAKTPAFVMIGSLGFMLIARSYSGIVELLRLDERLVASFANPQAYIDTMSAFRYFLPDLGSLDIRIIALYGTMELLPVDWFLRLLSGSAYVVAICFFSILVVARRNF